MGRFCVLHARHEPQDERAKLAAFCPRPPGNLAAKAALQYGDRKTMKIALLQMPVTLEKDDNLKCAEEYIRTAAKDGADIAVLPEMFCCPYSNDHFAKYAEPANGRIWNFLSGEAEKHSIYLVGGSMPESENGKIYNTSFVFDRKGTQIARHRKAHLFDIDIDGGQSFHESKTFAAGSDVTLFDNEFGRIGLCICFDMRFPEMSRLMALDGAKMIIVPAAFNMTTGPMHWEMLFRQRAVDDQLFTAGIASARDENGPYVSYANTILCSPWGKVIARADKGAEIITATIDFDETEKARSQLPLLKARRDDIYRLER